MFFSNSPDTIGAYIIDNMKVACFVHIGFFFFPVSFVYCFTWPFFFYIHNVKYTNKIVTKDINWCINCRMRIGYVGLYLRIIMKWLWQKDFLILLRRCTRLYLIAHFWTMLHIKKFKRIQCVKFQPHYSRIEWNRLVARLMKIFKYYEQHKEVIA